MGSDRSKVAERRSIWEDAQPAAPTAKVQRPKESFSFPQTTMRREGSRYGLKPTNRSLKHAMQLYQDVKGVMGLIWLPDNDSVPLSMKKHARWEWVQKKEIPDATEDPVWHESYTTQGLGCSPAPSLTMLRGSGKPVVSVEYIGRFKAQTPSSVRVRGGISYDERYAAYGTKSCCGCNMCSERPRHKASKKTKGRRKHGEQFDDL
jgi:hypothetical protein